MESVVSGLRLVLVCDECPCEPPGSGCLVQKGLPSRSLARGPPVGTRAGYTPQQRTLGSCPLLQPPFGSVGQDKGKCPQTCVNIWLCPSGH